MPRINKRGIITPYESTSPSPIYKTFKILNSKFLKLLYTRISFPIIPVSCMKAWQNLINVVDICISVRVNIITNIKLQILQILKIFKILKLKYFLQFFSFFIEDWRSSFLSSIPKIVAQSISYCSYWTIWAMVFFFCLFLKILWNLIFKNVIKYWCFHLKT